MFAKDLATTIGVAIAGVLIAYFVSGMFIDSTPQSYSVKTVDSSVNTGIDEPSPEIFNYKSLNPTVEVYVGDCDGDNCNTTVEQTESEIIDIVSDDTIIQGNQ